MKKTEQKSWESIIRTLKDRAKEINITHEEIAKKLNKETSQISRFFSGKHCPNMKFIIDVANEVGVIIKPVLWI